MNYPSDCNVINHPGGDEYANFEDERELLTKKEIKQLRDLAKKDEWAFRGKVSEWQKTKRINLNYNNGYTVNFGEKLL